jgi:hypothetical protein
MTAWIDKSIFRRRCRARRRSPILPGLQLRVVTVTMGGRHGTEPPRRGMDLRQCLCTIADSIAKGRAFGMPAWAKMLTPAQIWQLTAYLKSLRTSREPQPPL